MSLLSSLCLAGCFVLLGVKRVCSIKRNTYTLYEILSFISTVKNNIRFSNMSYENLIEEAKKEDYKYINFNENITASCYVDKKVKADFTCFVNKIGTTDETGQLALCDEYTEKFKRYYNESVSGEKSRVNVVGAICILSVVCSLLLGV